MLVTLAAIAAACGGGGGAREPTPAAQARAAVAELTRQQLIGQHFVFAYRGTQPPKALVNRIRRGEAAGVVLFARNVPSVARLRAVIARLQRIPQPPAVRAPLLVMVDQEGGAVRRLPGAPVASAAQTANAAAARGNGRAAARLLRSAGVNVDLAPVADVARPGSAIEREGRAYGRTPARVVSLAGAFADGLRAGRVEPVLKHFPGFGAAVVNTDVAPARVDLPLSTLRRVDLAPYRALPARAVLASTAVYPRVDPRPAAFSARWITGELRERLRFGGVVITDDLEAPAVRSFGTPAQLAYYALTAGVDVPLFAHTYHAGAQAAKGLVDSPLTRAQLEAGAARVLALRRALGAG